MYGFSRERARQYEARAIRKIRNFAGTKDFALYLDNPDIARENLNKLIKWHHINPKSHIVYDIDLSKIKLDNQNDSLKIKGQKRKPKEDNIYNVLAKYRKDDIDTIVATLSEDEKRILKIRDEYQENPTLYSPWNNKSIRNDYDNIIKKICYYLDNPQNKKVKISTIYDLTFSKEYTKEAMQLAISMLEPQDQEIITLRYGRDLDNPIISEEWDFQKYGDIFYEVVVPHIIANLKLIRKQNKKIEEKIILINNNEELDSKIKMVYFKALKLLKLLEFRKLTLFFPIKETELLAILTIKYFENITINIDDFACLLEISQADLQKYLKNILLFLKQNRELFNDLKNKLYFTDEEEEIKNNVLK